MPYEDRYLRLDADRLSIRAYYFPWGTKHVAYSSIRSVQAFPMTLLGGKGRIWGSTTFKYWAGLDPKRPGKTTGVVIDTGRAVKIFCTPDDPDRFLAELSRLSGREVEHVQTAPVI